MLRRFKGTSTWYHIILLKICLKGLRALSSRFMSSWSSSTLGVSQIGNMSYGVAQWSVLGSILFILIINYLVTMSTDCHFILFADDTNILFSEESARCLESMIKSTLIKLNS